MNTINEPATAATIVQKPPPNLYAANIEASVDSWVTRLHFDETIEVNNGDSLGFAALKKGNVALMYGIHASLDADPGTAKAYNRGISTLFIEVEDVDGTLAVMEGAPLVSSLHKLSMDHVYLLWRIGQAIYSHLHSSQNASVMP